MVNNNRSANINIAISNKAEQARTTQRRGVQEQGTSRETKQRIEGRIIRITKREKNKATYTMPKRLITSGPSCIVSIVG